jgi:ABC-type nitrate/sulfonate/bicarbonate transport system permease component
MARAVSWTVLDTPKEASSPLVWLAHYAGWFVARSFTIIMLFVLWESLARSGVVSRFMLPPLAPVFERLMEDIGSGDFFLNTARTLWRAFAGFIIAGVAGVLLGMLMVRNAFARWFFEPIISAGFPMPKVAFLPIFILWFGVYDMSKIVMIVVDAIFPVITATMIGLQGVERELIWSARNMGATRREILWQIMVPAAMPQILTGLQIALPMAIIIAIATEMLMGGTGLGGAMLEASRMADSPGVFAGLIEMTVIGYAVLKAMSAVRRHVLVWHQESQRPTGL